MTFTPKEGMTCITRDGRKVGPIYLGPQPKKYPGDYWKSRDVGSTWWESGKVFAHEESPLDLVAEWSEPVSETQEAGPVRTETMTRMVIVPGRYDLVEVQGGGEGSGGFVSLSLVRSAFNAFELRALARHAISLAEALEQD